MFLSRIQALAFDSFLRLPNPPEKFSRPSRLAWLLLEDSSLSECYKLLAETILLPHGGCRAKASSKPSLDCKTVLRRDRTSAFIILLPDTMRHWPLHYPVPYSAVAVGIFGE
ncbi:hypothetical protein KIN20_030928 [Parelaphostrongylus tenuis]|uniref:Uncharacterized protein n=1 Tax=Parelaphostrongylus tenuis TaxID=148309 RepID=A0AAD5R4P7_PARTN|nr:hypothetical protein KIN20_030928 [Parelaphostrongylus tenuis]